ncbi:MAG: DNA topoisomerase 1 [bacterium]|nr:MAG: DNA topoisomerase 1 [bacterium]
MALRKSKKTAKKKPEKYLVIVESPAKASTIRQYLGRSFDVKASVGHIRDLPKSTLGVDVENGFKPKYITIKGKAGIVKELKSAAKKADIIYVAPDPDREGEAIAQHIREVIDQDEKIYRVSFNEVTKKAVRAALENPHQIDMKKVNAQQARRTLDRLVGYKLSPLLWSKVRNGLSAGRVQSVAMRIVTEREKEIEAFVAKEYWSIKCRLKPKDKNSFEAKLHHIDGKKFELGNEADTKEAVETIKNEKLTVDSLTVKDKKRNPPPPFITSTMQQAASQRLRFPAYRTMKVAQKLYEGMEIESREKTGLITYMRTDSVRVAGEALEEVRKYIGDNLGSDYLPEKPNFYKSRKTAQEAHEAVRPTSPARTPESIKQFLSADEFKIYELIWKRFVASQVKHAVITTTTADIAAGRYTIRGTGSRTKFDGFLRIYLDVEDNSKEPENIIPPLEQGEGVNLEEITPNQHFTQPPPRYSEATLIRELEEQGIGRPSTYAAIMGTIQSRDYVETIERKLHPTKLGRLITDMLVKHFAEIMNIKFTAQMEENLDAVEEGAKNWVTLLEEFYSPFIGALDAAEKNMECVKEDGKSDEICDKCGSEMTVKFGRFGRFLACSKYPECKNTKQLSKNGETKSEPEKIDEKCPTCGEGMVIRSGRFGKFIACSKYPECKTTKPVTLGIKCPKKCGGELVERRTKKRRIFYGCASYPKCDFVSWEKPVSEACPKCSSPYLVYAKSAKPDVTALKCPVKECDFTKELPKQEAANA